mmetsp:Transcript_5275/g.8839  ORF Transcript_5275/g.8839 Transcript_5275/m.8839 type:complete len:105 (-) Transcript_5275:1856-2170(-)
MNMMRTCRSFTPITFQSKAPSRPSSSSPERRLRSKRWAQLDRLAGLLECASKKTLEICPTEFHDTRSTKDALVPLLESTPMWKPRRRVTRKTHQFGEIEGIPAH